MHDQPKGFVLQRQLLFKQKPIWRSADHWESSFCNLWLSSYDLWLLVHQVMLVWAKSARTGAARSQRGDNPLKFMGSIITQEVAEVFALYMSFRPLSSAQGPLKRKSQKEKLINRMACFPFPFFRLHFYCNIWSMCHLWLVLTALVQFNGMPEFCGLHFSLFYPPSSVYFHFPMSEW